MRSLIIAAICLSFIQTGNTSTNRELFEVVEKNIRENAFLETDKLNKSYKNQIVASDETYCEFTLTKVYENFSVFFKDVISSNFGYFSKSRISSSSFTAKSIKIRVHGLEKSRYSEIESYEFDSTGDFYKTEKIDYVIIDFGKTPKKILKETIKALDKLSKNCRVIN